MGVWDRYLSVAGVISVYIYFFFICLANAFSSGGNIRLVLWLSAGRSSCLYSRRSRNHVASSHTGDSASTRLRNPTLVETHEGLRRGSVSRHPLPSYLSFPSPLLSFLLTHLTLLFYLSLSLSLLSHTPLFPFPLSNLSYRPFLPFPFSLLSYPPLLPSPLTFPSLPPLLPPLLPFPLSLLVYPPLFPSPLSFPSLPPVPPSRFSLPSVPPFVFLPRSAPSWILTPPRRKP